MFIGSAVIGRPYCLRFSFGILYTLALTIFLPPLLLCFHRTKGSDLKKSILLTMESSNVFFSELCLAVALFIYPRLLQEEASLMLVVEQDSTLKGEL